MTPAVPPPPPSAAVVADLERAFAVIEAICSRTRGLRDTCFYRAVARYGTWQSVGVPARFVMAVRRDPSGNVEGHAWVERGGTPDNKEHVSDYTVTFAFPT